MANAHIRLYSYQNKLTQPIKLGNENILSRDGLIFHIIDKHGHHGTGEIAPLPSFSKETLLNSESQIKAFMDTLNENLDIHKIREHYISLQKTFYPSVKFGIESALNCIQHQIDRPGEIAYTSANINALLQHDASNVTELVQAGYSCFKVKVGEIPIHDEILRVNKIIGHLSSHQSLRLDANQKWTYEDAVTFWNGLEHSHLIEYVEEPLQDVTQLEELYHETSMPMALDESLRMSIRPMFKGIDALIYKPTLMGGKSTLLYLMEQYKHYTSKIILSSSYESGIGLLNIARMNLNVLNNANPMGIDTYRYLKTDILQDPLHIVGGKLEAILTPSHQCFFNKNKLRFIYGLQT